MKNCRGWANFIIKFDGIREGKDFERDGLNWLPGRKKKQSVNQLRKLKQLNVCLYLVTICFLYTSTNSINDNEFQQYYTVIFYKCFIVVYCLNFDKG